MTDKNQSIGSKLNELNKKASDIKKSSKRLNHEQERFINDLKKYNECHPEA